MTPLRHVVKAGPLHAWLLAALLLAAQGWGLAHRIAHAPGWGQGGAAVAAADPAHQHAHQHAHPHASPLAHPHAQAHARAAWVDSHEPDTTVCRLIDQLAHADGLCDGAWAAASMPQAADTPDAAPAGLPRAGSASAYLARAPPLA